MPNARSSEFYIVDDAFPPEFTAELLDFALSHDRDFRAAPIDSKDPRIDASYRTSLECGAHFGALGERLDDALVLYLPELCRRTGIRPFDCPHPEFSLVANGDGQFYKTHIDSAVGKQLVGEPSIRVLTAVLYFHRLPRAFSGGELVLKPVDGSSPVKIEPRHNRLVAFPAMTPHEVLPTKLPVRAFANARFSLNCWFHRTRKHVQCKEKEAGLLLAIIFSESIAFCVKAAPTVPELQDMLLIAIA